LTVWPPNTRTDRGSRQRRSAASATRALLCVACLLGCALVSRGQSAAVADETFAPREKDVRRAEKVLEKLRLLDEAAAAVEDGGDFRRLARKLYPGLFVTVADMRPGDLKTDLDTAVFLYEDVGRAWSAAGNSAADCEQERPDVYLPLCLGLAGGTARQLLLAKARLHARWAEAVVKTYRGEGGVEISGRLSELKTARAHDLLIAARVSETLKALEGLVNTSPTYADYQEHRSAAKVGFEKLDAEFADALGRVHVLLGWLPRSPVYYHLSGAMRSYVDGLFWYRKVYSSGKKVVSAAAGFERDPLKDLRLDAEQVGYTVVSNWKTAAKYTRRAEQALSGAARR
jgi:hypothetical protein